MLKLSKKIEYAIIATLDIAGNKNGELTTAKDLSGKYNIPPELMGKVLQSLAKEGVILSQKGVKGGYKLFLPLKEININKIINAVEGPIKLVDCTSELDCGCGQETHCNIKTPMVIIQEELTNFFDSITLQDFKDKYNGIIPLIQIQS